jgi:hypothetical protein
MKNTDKLNLDDIDFDSALGGMDDDAPDGMTIPVDDEVEDNIEDVVEETEASEEETEENNDEAADETTDEETDDDETSNDVDTVVGEIRKKLGFEIDGDFDDTPDGLLELTKAAASKVADEQLDELFKAMPDVEQYLKYRLQGGDSAKFFNTFYGDVDYGSLDLQEEDTVTQEHLVRQAMELKGFEREDIEESVQEFKNSGLLHSQASKALKGLAKHQVREQGRLIEEQERAAAQAQAQSADYWKEVETTLQGSSEFRGIPVSEKEKRDLLEYLSKPVQDGLSAFQIALNQAPVDVYLAIASLMKKDFNIDGIVSRKAKTQQAQTLKEKLSKSKESLKSRAQKPKGIVDKPDFDSLELSL